MPEVTIDEEYCFIFGIYKALLAGQTLVVEPVSETAPKQRCSDNDFRAGVLAFDTRHHLQAFGPADHVRRQAIFLVFLGLPVLFFSLASST